MAAYVRPPGGVYTLHTLQIFTVRPGGVAHTVVYQDPVVFGLFDLPATISP